MAYVITTYGIDGDVYSSFELDSKEDVDKYLEEVDGMESDPFSKIVIQDPDGIKCELSTTLPKTRLQ